MTVRSRWLVGVMVVAAGLIGWIRVASGAWGGGGGAAVGGGGGSSTPWYSVVAVRDTTGSVSFQAMVSSEVKKTEKKLNDEYKAAGSISGPKPQKPSVTVIESKIRGKDAKQKAEAMASKLQTKYDEKKSKKEGDEPAAGAKNKDDAAGKKVKPEQG